MPSRTFNIEDLDEIGYDNELKVERHTGRWNVYSDVVFRAEDDGKLYVVNYCEGLTEYQETYGSECFPDSVCRDGEWFVECFEVELYDEMVTVKNWRVVK